MRSTHENYPAPTTRRRLLVALLAVATAITIGWLMLVRPGSVKPQRVLPPDAARCAAGQQVDCVGGLATVIAPPLAASAASASRP